jgi:hypothetical protein
MIYQRRHTFDDALNDVILSIQPESVVEPEPDEQECGQPCDHCLPEILHHCTLPARHSGFHDGHTKDRW